MLAVGSDSEYTRPSRVVLKRVPGSSEIFEAIMRQKRELKKKKKKNLPVRAANKRPTRGVS